MYVPTSSIEVFEAYPPKVALVLCTSERCTGTFGHMLWLQCIVKPWSVTNAAQIIQLDTCGVGL